MDISIVSAYISMKFLPLIDNIHMERTVSQICAICSRFDFITKNGKLIVIFIHFFLNIYCSFHKMRTKIYIKILRHRSLHIYHKNKQ